MRHRGLLTLACLGLLVGSLAEGAKPLHVNVRDGGDVMGAVRTAQTRTRPTLIRTAFGQLRVARGQKVSMDLAGGHHRGDPSSGIAVATGIASHLGELEVTHKGRPLGTLDTGSASKFGVQVELDRLRGR